MAIKRRCLGDGGPAVTGASVGANTAIMHSPSEHETNIPRG